MNTEPISTLLYTGPPPQPHPVLPIANVAIEFDKEAKLAAKARENDAQENGNGEGGSPSQASPSGQDDNSAALDVPTEGAGLEKKRAKSASIFSSAFSRVSKLKDAAGKKLDEARANTHSALKSMSVNRDIETFQRAFPGVAHKGAALVLVSECKVMHSGNLVVGSLFVTSHALCFLSSSKSGPSPRLAQVIPLETVASIVPCVALQTEPRASRSLSQSFGRPAAATTTPSTAARVPSGLSNTSFQSESAPGPQSGTPRRVTLDEDEAPLHVSQEVRGGDASPTDGFQDIPLGDDSPPKHEDPTAGGEVSASSEDTAPAGPNSSAVGPPMILPIPAALVVPTAVAVYLWSGSPGGAQVFYFLGFTASFVDDLLTSGSINTAATESELPRSINQTGDPNDPAVAAEEAAVYGSDQVFQRRLQLVRNPTVKALLAMDREWKQRCVNPSVRSALLGYRQDSTYGPPHC